MLRGCYAAGWLKLQNLKEGNVLIRRVLKNCSTGADGETYNPVRLIGYMTISASVFITCLAAVHMLFTKDVFDYAAFGQGIALLMGSLFAVGATDAVTAKSGTEPKVAP